MRSPATQPHEQTQSPDSRAQVTPKKIRYDNRNGQNDTFDKCGNRKICCSTTMAH